MNPESSMKHLLAWIALAAMLLGVGSVRAQDIAPDALVKKTTDDIIGQIRKDKDLAINSPRLLELVDAKVLPHFNFTRMTMLAVGRPWRDATPAQREQLVRQFRTLLVRTYSTALEQYSDQTIDVKPAVLKPDDAETIVRTQINQKSGPPIPMDYRMEKTPQGWKVFDVTVEGVSIVTTYRSTFASEVSKGGIDGLIKTITEQNARLEQRTTARK
jgi:phospholipid transport system substrate-binding protein